MLGQTLRTIEIEISLVIKRGDHRSENDSELSHRSIVVAGALRDAVQPQRCQQILMKFEPNRVI